MATPEEFAAACRDAGRGLRRLPKDLRRAIGVEVREQVAVPMAGKIAAAATGPWASVFKAGGVKTRALADPTIVVGGMRPKLSGGASPRQLVYGTEFGGGKRLKAVPRNDKHRGYRRYATNQFARNHRPFVFPTIEANVPWVLDKFADITITQIEKAVNTRG